MARPTKSRALFEQMVGRGLRPHELLAPLLGELATPQDRRVAIEASPKPYCEVIDFVGNTGQHKLVTVADVLGGRYDEVVRERAAKKASASSESGIPADVAELLKLTKEELDEAERQRREREVDERRRRERLRVGVTYRTKEINPFGLYDVKPPRVVTFDKTPKATEAQVDFLRRRGIEINAAKTT